MGEKPRSEELVDKIASYLSNLDGIKLFVISSEGLPLKWSQNLNQDNAEELTALATDLTLAATKFKKVADPREVTIVIASGDKALASATPGDLQIIVEGVANVADAAMKNIKKFVRSPIECPYCGKDLTLAIFKCPHCQRKIPLGTRKCPFCDKTIRYLKCPYCSELVTSEGRTIKYERPRLYITVGSVLLALAAGVSTLVYVALPPMSKILSAVPAVLLSAVAAYLISIKEIVAEE